MRKKLLPIIVVAIVAVSVVVAGSVLHWWGQGPSNGGAPEEPSGNETTNPPVTPSAKIFVTEGNVFVMKAGTGNWTEAQREMTLEPGDIIKSGDDSSAEITFFDGSIIELEAGTQIEVVSLAISEAGSTTIKLKQAIGTTISRVVKLVDSASTYEVETPACVAAVRGSVMVVEVIQDGTTWVTNEEGEICVTAQGVELCLREGQKCIIIPGQPPQLIPSVRGGGGGGGVTPTPDIAIKKMPDSMQVHDYDIITYTYVVTNPGDLPLSNVSVTDDRIEHVVYQSGDTDGDGRLDTTETWIFAANYTVSGDDPSPLVNHAAAAGTDSRSRTIIAWASASVDILRPAIAINKTGELWEYEGYSINYTYTITNPGNTPLYDISVIDNMIEQVTYQSGDTDHDDRLDRTETWIFTATYWLGEEDGEVITNTATVSGTDALGLTVTDEATASVSVIETASIYVQIESGSPASMFIWDENIDIQTIYAQPTTWIAIWDETNGDWAIDQETGDPVDGNHHEAPDTIIVAAGHYYYVWVEAGEVWYYVSGCPVGWNITSPPGYEVDAAYGYAEAGYLYSVTFSAPYVETASIDIQIVDPELPTASIFIWDDTLGQWAIDEDTGWAVNGTNHTTPSTIEVAGGHYYYVWVEGEVWYYVDEWPDGWEVTSPPGREVDAARGLAEADNLYSVNFTASVGV